MSEPYDQVSFLMLCIKHCGGKIDFNALAKEAESSGELLTPNAHRNRYTRLKAKLDGGADPIPTGKSKKDGKVKREREDDIIKSDLVKEKKIKREIKREVKKE
jgi:hypothetical protein